MRIAVIEHNHVMYPCPPSSAYLPGSWCLTDTRLGGHQMSGLSVVNLVYRVTHPHFDSTTAFQANEHWLLYVDISSWHYYLLSILSSRRKDVLAA